jgi:hypothetical protein
MLSAKALIEIDPLLDPISAAYRVTGGEPAGAG